MTDSAIPHAPRWQTLLAFAIIYFVWGTTFLAIRIGVQEIPPFLFAAMRFLIAGSALVLWELARGTRAPTRAEWTSASVLAVLIFVFDYGGLFWAEQRVPSGLASVMLATIPAFMVVWEILLLRTQRLTPRLSAAILIGIGGVAVLVSRSLNLGGAPIDTLGALVLIFAAISFTASAPLTRKLPLPPSKVMSSGAQMFAGGVLLALTAAAFGELRGFHPAAISRATWIALAYLTIFGSIVAFTAYVWLIHRESPTKVSTYAYVNPVVAVLIGYFFAGEALGLRTALGTLLILTSVVLITLGPKPNSIAAAKPLAQEAAGVEGGEV